MTNAVNIAQGGTNNVSWRNRIINGAMVIDQRNAGASVTTSGGNNFDPDRWLVYDSVGSKMSVQRVADAPSGFTHSQKITSLAATTPGSTDYYFDCQRIEGFNVADLAWGTASAATVTLSFWVKSSLTGSFSGAFGNASFSRSYPFSYTINAANTWEQKTVTVAGDTTGTWATDNSTGLQVLFDLGSGSSRAGTANTWSANDYRKVTGSVNLIGTNGATFYITGVQLEKGTSASPFEYRDYGRELMMCCRYYWQLDATSSPYTIIGITGNTDAIHTYWNPVPMRAAPSAAFASGSFTAFYFTSAGSGQLSTSIVQGVNTVNFNTSTNGGRFYFTKSGQTGLVAWCDFGGSSAKFTISAEL